MYGFGSIVDGEIEDTDVNDVTDDAEERIEGREPPDCWRRRPLNYLIFKKAFIQYKLYSKMELKARIFLKLPWSACLIPDSGVFELKLFNVAFDKPVISPTARMHGVSTWSRSSKKTLQTN